MEVAAIAATIPFTFVFVLSGLLINLIQAALFLTVRPLSKRTYRRINGVVSEILWLEIVWLMDWWGGLEVKVYTDLKTYELMGKERALLMPNHLSDIDTFIIWLLAQRLGCLQTALTVVKKSTQYLPIFGWATWFFEFVFLDRKWGKDEKKLKASFEGLKDFPKPFWLTLFVEGTRLTPDKLLEAQDYAISKGLNPPKNVLIPRTKGLVAAVQCFSSFVPAIYDVTIAVPKGYPNPSLLRILKRQSTPVSIHIKRHSMKQMPESAEGIAQWCRDRFLAKDTLLEKFKATGKLEDQEIKEFRHRSVISMLVMIFWAFFLSIGASVLFERFSLLSTWRGFGFLAFGLAFMATTTHIFIEFTKLPPQKQAQLAA